MEYTKQQINRFANKDRRISWLSIFSSLCTLYAGQEKAGTLAKVAFDLNRDLNTKYPDDGNPETPYSMGTEETPKGF